MTLPINPYVAGNPVGDSPAFIGRTDVLREVLRRPQDNAIVLYGQRRIGKTSVLQELAARLPREGPYYAIYFDLQDKAAWPLDRVLGDLARTIAYALGQPDPNLGADPEIAFRQEWLPAILDDLAEGASLVLLFDEFDVLADPKAEQAAAAFFPYLRNLLATDPQRLEFVFVIGRNVTDLSNANSPLAQAYQVCKDNNFGAFVVERLLAQIEQAKQQLVLLRDEFDVLLHHPVLDPAEFFGSLR